MLKLNKLFHKVSSDAKVFEDRISPTREQRKFLMECKNKIREHLKPRIRAATKTVLGMEHVVEPRFRTQGSWSYNTCIVPAKLPIQEMDWDYGVYLPVTVWEENGPPHQMAKAYFSLVEELLKDLCKAEKWELITGKTTCIRVQVAEWAHIDLPLYAAPEDEFESITERVSLEKALLDGSDPLFNARAMDESYEPQEWKDLVNIAMATRSGEWRDSDPEAVANWFRDRIDEHGEQLRRVCRYLKAWRDVHWDIGGPTSVSIMIAVAQNFVSQPGRDDLVTEVSAKHLGSIFLGEIREAGIDDKRDDFNRLDGSERATAARRFAELGSAICECRMMRENQKVQALERMRAQFGSRMPWDTSLIEVGGDAESIRNDVPEKVAPPVVLSTSAG